VLLTVADEEKDEELQVQDSTMQIDSSDAAMGVELGAGQFEALGCLSRDDVAVAGGVDNEGQSKGDATDHSDPEPLESRAQLEVARSPPPSSKPPRPNIAEKQREREMRIAFIRMPTCYVAMWLDASVTDLDAVAAGEVAPPLALPIDADSEAGAMAQLLTAMGAKWEGILLELFMTVTQTLAAGHAGRDGVFFP